MAESAVLMSRNQGPLSGGAQQMNLSMSERKVLLAIGELAGGNGVNYSNIGDLAGDGAVRVIASLEMKGLVHIDGGTVTLTSLGAVVLQTYR